MPLDCQAVNKGTDNIHATLDCQAVNKGTDNIHATLDCQAVNKGTDNIRVTLDCQAVNKGTDNIRVTLDCQDVNKGIDNMRVTLDCQAVNKGTDNIRVTLDCQAVNKGTDNIHVTRSCSHSAIMWYMNLEMNHHVSRFNERQIEDWAVVSSIDIFVNRDIEDRLPKALMLKITDEVIMKAHQVVIPASLKADTIGLVHVGHKCTDKTRPTQGNMLVSSNVEEDK